MFQRKLILTATTFGLLEDIRTAIEVLNGTRIRFKHIEFDKGLMTGHGAFYLNGTELPLIFIKDCHANDVMYELGIGKEWYIARFDTPQQVRVIRNIGSRCWMVGTSATDRHKEPIFPSKK